MSAAESTPEPSPRRRRTLVGGVIVIAVAAIAVAIWAVLSSSQPASAKDAAQAYLDALASGETSAIEATGIDVSPETLLAFESATSLIDRATVEHVDQQESTARVRVSFELDNEEHEVDLTLTSVDGRWLVDAAGLGQISATTTRGTAASIGNATFATTEGIPLLPAVYTVSAAPSDVLDGSARIVVLPAESTEVAVDASLRPEATEVAQALLHEHADKCAVSTEVSPEGCGIRIPWATEFRSIDEARYRVETAPTITLSDDGTSFTSAGGVLVATLTGTAHDGSTATTTYRANDWSLRGDVGFTATEMVLDVW